MEGDGDGEIDEPGTEPLASNDRVPLGGALGELDDVDAVLAAEPLELVRDELGVVEVRAPAVEEMPSDVPRMVVRRARPPVVGHAFDAVDPERPVAVVATRV